LVEQPPPGRPNTQDGEVASRDDLGVDRRGSAVVGEMDLRGITREEAIEDLVLRLQVAEQRVRQEVPASPAAADERAVPAQEAEPLGLPDGKLPEQDLVHQGE